MRSRDSAHILDRESGKRVGVDDNIKEPVAIGGPHVVDPGDKVAGEFWKCGIGVHDASPQSMGVVDAELLEGQRGLREVGGVDGEAETCKQGWKRRDTAAGEPYLPPPPFPPVSEQGGESCGVLAAEA